MKKIRQAAVNVIIIAGFMLSAVGIANPFLAERHFNNANSILANHRWDEAEIEFKNSLKYEPSNSQYVAGLASFFKEKAVSGQDKVAFLLKAVDLYRKAMVLNPHNAEYAFGLGQTEIMLFLTDDKKFAGELRSGFDNFIKAYQNDPNGFIISYQIGYAGIAVWAYLGNRDKDFIIARLNTALTLRPWYCAHIYSRLWRKTKNFELLIAVTPNNFKSYSYLYNFLADTNLWQFRKRIASSTDLLKKEYYPAQYWKDRDEVKKSIESIKHSYPIGKWKGKSDYGENEIVDGLMYWNGTLYMVVSMKPGKADISISAKKFLVIKTDKTGNPKFYPYMIVRLDGEEIGESFVSNDEWQKYEFPVSTDGGLKVLGISFVNDIYDKEREEDRNLGVGDISILYE